VTARDIQSLSERIDGEELLSQRLKFGLVRYSLLPARRKKPSPFRSD
jgi:serine/threonine-protein kinase HipA